MIVRSAGSLIAPVFLRLALGVMFVWAGLAKVMESRDYTGEEAALLVKWGVAPEAAIAAPSEAKPKGADAPLDPKADPKAEPGKDASKPDSAVQVTTPAAVVHEKNLYSIATMLYQLATPAPRADGSQGMALVPAKAAEGKMPVILAWAATITEICGGVCCLIGFFTRVAALGIASVMGVAMWLTQIGPAVLSSNARFGFLPSYAPFAREWQDLFLQFTLACVALALVFAGAGFLSLDRLLFHRPTVVVKPVVAAPPA